jgi:hypothetical protein
LPLVFHPRFKLHLIHRKMATMRVSKVQIQYVLQAVRELTRVMPDTGNEKLTGREISVTLHDVDGAAG